MVDTQAIPPFVLTLAYWLHLLATVVWIGGLAALSLIVIPAARRALEPPAYSALLTQIRPRLQNTGWFSLAVLTVSGMFQMSSNPSYEGFMAINNPWAVAILAKHAVIGLMVIVGVYVTWGVLPALQRMAILRAAGRDLPPAEADRLHRRESTMLWANVALSVIVLLLTAWARSVSG